MPGTFEPFREKMEAAGLSEAAVHSFARSYEILVRGDSPLIGEESIESVVELPRLQDVEGECGGDLVGQAVIIKLNGGLGTGMGLSRAKSLLVIRDGMSFLDIIVKQVLDYRGKYANKIPLILMNSFRTDKDTKKELAKYKDLATDIPLTFLQHKVPKILQDSLTPAEWPPDPTLEWNPPGHGEVYTALSI